MKLPLAGKGEIRPPLLKMAAKMTWGTIHQSHFSAQQGEGADSPGNCAKAYGN